MCVTGTAMTQAPPAFSTLPPSHGGAPDPDMRDDPAPIYQANRYADIWTHWAAVDRANQRVAEIQVTLAELEPELQAKTKEIERLKEKSSKLFESLHGKSRSIMPNALKRIHSGGSSTKEKETKEVAKQDFEVAHREETLMMMQIETLTERVDGLKTQMQNNMRLASESDQVFELLGASVARSIPNSTASITAAEEHLATATTNLDLAQKMVTDLLRARVTVQHAHHYYTTVLQTIDAVRGTALGRAAIGGMGEMSKNQDYQIAAETASKAQVCFNEAVRVLTPHTATFPLEVMTDFVKLKEMGLLQASKIYGLMYGWKHATAGVGKSVKLMLEKQEIVFASLTRLAVWVQNRVPVSEVELGAARASRDRARRDLAAAWNVEFDRSPVIIIS